jgi:3-isopropylmalate/(R)-2-methylmalate dehydratase small subunit
MKEFGGSVLFLDRDDINTDELIPAKYLNEDSKASLKPYIMEDLSLPGFDRDRDLPGKKAVVTHVNFGCGSSREHAPWVLEANGINIVVAASFARIFRQNMFNCGMIAVELPKETIDTIFRRFGTATTMLSLDLESGMLSFASPSNGDTMIVPFTLGEFERAMVKAGGWVQFAAEKY